MVYASDYPIFSVTVDVVVFCRPVGNRATGHPRTGDLQVLLVRRATEPYRGLLALPGGFVDIDEDLPEAARRELGEETGVDGVEIHQLGTYGAPGRDPRGRTISIVYVAEVASELPLTAGDDAADAGWFSLIEVVVDDSLAFDHAQILRDAQAHLDRTGPERAAPERAAPERAVPERVGEP
jgi:8-oxo-dGTP diphosphatase